MDEYLDVTFLLKYDNTRLPAGSRPIGLRLGVYSIGFRIRLWSICIIYNYSCTGCSHGTSPRIELYFSSFVFVL